MHIFFFIALVVLLLKNTVTISFYTTGTRLNKSLSVKEFQFITNEVYNKKGVS